MNITKLLSQLQIGKKATLQKYDWLQEFELLRTNEDPVVGDSVDTTSQVGCPPLACEFCPVSGQTYKFAVADELGYIVLYDSRKSLLHSHYESIAAHDNAVFDISWLSSDMKLLTASGDQTLALIDMNTCETVETFKAHNGSVKSVDVLPGSNAVFASGSRDGHIMIWDARCNKKGETIPPVNTIRNAHCVDLNSATKTRKKYKLGPVLDNQQSVTVVLCQSDINVFSSGAVDGLIKLWDLRKNYCICGQEPLAKLNFPYPGQNERKCGFSCLAFDSYNSRLYANCTDNVIYEYDVATYSQVPICAYAGHFNNSFYVKSAVSSDNKCLVTGSSDSTAYLYQIGKPEKSPVVLPQHANEVTGVAWSPHDFGKIVTLCDDNMVRLWTIVRRDDISQKTCIYAKAEIRSSTPCVTPLKPRKRPMPTCSSPTTPPQCVKKPKQKLTPSSSGKPKVKSPSITRWFTRDISKHKSSNQWTSPSKVKNTKECLSPSKRKIPNEWTSPSKRRIPAEWFSPL